MNTAAVTSLWILALGTLYIVLAPMLDFMHTTFSYFSLIGL